MNPAPARGYKWADAGPGNTLALKHGADSERFIAERAVEVKTRILELAPWVDKDVFIPAVARYMRAEARELLLHDFITDVAVRKGVGAVPQRLWEQATAATNAAGKAAADLGLTPQSYARLRATTGHAAATEAGLDKLLEQGRTIVEQHQPQAVTE